MGFPKLPIVPKKPVLPKPKAPAPAPAPKPKAPEPKPDAKAPEPKTTIEMPKPGEQKPARKKAPAPAPKSAEPEPKKSIWDMPKAIVGKGGDLIKRNPTAAAGIGGLGLGALGAWGLNKIFGGDGNVNADADADAGGGALNNGAGEVEDGGRGRNRVLPNPAKPAAGAGGVGGWAVVNPPAGGFPLRKVDPVPDGPRINPPANPKAPGLPAPAPGIGVNPAVPQPPPPAQKGEGRIRDHIAAGGQMQQLPAVIADRARPEDDKVDLTNGHTPEQIDAVNGWRNEILGAIQRGDPVDKRGRADLHNLMTMEHRMKQGGVTPQMQEEYSRALSSMFDRYGAPRINAARKRNEQYRDQAGKRGQDTADSPRLPSGSQAQSDAVLNHLGKPANGKKVVKNSRNGAPLRYEKTSYIMASSNIKEDPNRSSADGPGLGHANTGVPITYPDAMSAHRNDPRTQIARGRAAEFIKRFTGGNAVSSPAFGVWKDGGEDSVVHQVSGEIPHADLRKAAANIGLTHGQKAVLAFTPHEDGQHFFSTFQVPNADPQALSNELKSAGVENHTLVPSKGGMKVHVFDDGGMTDGQPLATQALHKWGAARGVPVATEAGTGSFVGTWGTRFEGKSKYYEEDPSLKPGSSRPYADRQIITKKGGGMRMRYSAEQAAADAKHLAGGEVGSGSLAVMTRYLKEMESSDPDRFEKLMQQHDAPGREIHYKWLDSLGDGTNALLKHLASQPAAGPDGKKSPSGSLSKIAKSVMTDPTNYRRNLRDLHHQLLDAGFYQPGVRPVWPDRERLMEVSGKLKEMGRLGELDQYIQGVQKGEPMVDLEESQSPAPPEQEDDKPCAKCSSGMNETIQRLAARGIRVLA